MFNVTFTSKQNYTQRPECQQWPRYLGTSIVKQLLKNRIRQAISIAFNSLPRKIWSKYLSCTPIVSNQLKPRLFFYWVPWPNFPWNWSFIPKNIIFSRVKRPAWHQWWLICFTLHTPDAHIMLYSVIYIYCTQRGKTNVVILDMLGASDTDIECMTFLFLPQFYCVFLIYHTKIWVEWVQ